MRIIRKILKTAQPSDNFAGTDKTRSRITRTCGQPTDGGPNVHSAKLVKTT
jgi:hypothetical protein